MIKLKNKGLPLPEKRYYELEEYREFIDNNRDKVCTKRNIKSLLNSALITARLAACFRFYDSLLNKYKLDRVPLFLTDIAIFAYLCVYIDNHEITGILPNLLYLVILFLAGISLVFIGLPICEWFISRTLGGYSMITKSGKFNMRTGGLSSRGFDMNVLKKDFVKLLEEDFKDCGKTVKADTHHLVVANLKKCGYFGKDKNVKNLKINCDEIYLIVGVKEVAYNYTVKELKAMKKNYLKNGVIPKEIVNPTLKYKGLVIEPKKVQNK